MYLSLFPFRETSSVFFCPRKSSPFPREDEAFKKKATVKTKLREPFVVYEAVSNLLGKTGIFSAPKPRGKSDPFVVYAVSSVGCRLCSLGTLSDDD